MNDNLKIRKINITYNYPLEKINKEFRKTMLDTIRNFKKSKLFEYFIIYLFTGLFLGTISYNFFRMLFRNEFEFVSFTNILFMFIGFVVSIILFFYEFIPALKNRRDQILQSTTSEDSVFIKMCSDLTYDVSFGSFFSFEVRKLIHCYYNYERIKEVLPQLIEAKLSGLHPNYILNINYRAENGDVKTERVSVDCIINNVDIEEPELRVGDDYKITLVIPYFYESE